MSRNRGIHNPEPTVAENIAWAQISMLSADDRVVFHSADEDGQEPSEEARKPIEVKYDIDAIPPSYKHPLDFRNEAMALVERALQGAGAGEWAGAEIGMGEVSFGFEVEDFEHAEKIVRKAVKATPFECIREIARFAHPNDLHAAE